MSYLQNQLDANQKLRCQEMQSAKIEQDFLKEELNCAHLVQADLKAKLSHKHEEVTVLKESLNSQISEVHGNFESQLNQKSDELQKLTHSAKEKDTRIQELMVKLRHLTEQHDNLHSTLQRQRDVLRQTNIELVEAQSARADYEEKLIQTESRLINTKASWAQAEHEKEELVIRLAEVKEAVGLNSISEL